MTKRIIGTAVAGILLFLWQFLSWSKLNVHGSEMQYTDKQDAVLQVLSEKLKEGTYFLPNVAPNSTAEQQSAYMESSAGKPWATVNYHESMNTNMGMNMTRAIVIDLLSAFLLIWLFGKMANPSFQTILLSSLAVGFIGYLTIPYLNSVWFETSSFGYLVDAIGQWGLVGLWLGWYLNRK
ncbi:MAG: hypothetical protein K9J46_09265 [Saprospiraceae bacterium]|nr:hypothetical protein [Saprospiraceae bacterium]MCF8282141.1 hypothetical protein [Bacteroidales bacterium]